MDQIILFGDSITQQAGDPALGYSFTAALQDGDLHTARPFRRSLTETAYIRR